MSNYYSGTTTGFADLKSTLISTCVAEGWTNSSDQLSKNGVHVLVTSDGSAYLGLLGRSGDGTGPAPNEVRIGGYIDYAVTKNITFPCNYEIFIFEQEVYLIVNYDVEFYQFLAFGKSTLTLPGTGLWVAATRGSAGPGGTAGPAYLYQTSNIDLAGFSSDNVAPGLFHTSQSNLASRRAYWVNHGFDSTDWFWQTGGSITSEKVGVRESFPLYLVSPTSYTSESALLPMRAYVTRSSNLISLAVDCQYARRVRIDQYAPKEIITIGSDQWKVYPNFRKNSNQRNGEFVFGSGDLGHTGTYGWALKYVPD
jgi:hypothetical protein